MAPALTVYTRHLHLSLIYFGKVRSLPFEWSSVRVKSALPEYIRLGWKCLTVTRTLVFDETELITTVKSFTVQVPFANRDDDDDAAWPVACIIKLLRS